MEPLSQNNTSQAEKDDTLDGSTIPRELGRETLRLASGEEIDPRLLVRGKRHLKVLLDPRYNYFNSSWPPVNRRLKSSELRNPDP